MARRSASQFLGIGIDIRGDDGIAKSMLDMGSAVRARVRATLVDLAEELLQKEKAGMRVRTGQTRDSFDYALKETDRGITARIGWWRTGGPGGTGWKAIFQESGVQGPVTVKRFARGSRGGYLRKTITLKSGRKRRIKVVLGTFERNVHIAARPFVRPAWDAVKPRVLATLDAAIEQAKKESGLA